MTRNDIIAEILYNSGEDTTNWDIYEKYSTSQLKKILDDLKTVHISFNDVSITRYIILAGIFVLAGIVFIKRL